MMLVVLISLVSITVGIVDYLYSSRMQTAQFESNAARYESDLHQLLELPLWNVDDALIKKIGSAITTNKEFAYLSIRDEKQRVIYHYSKYDGDIIKRELVVRHNGQIIGSAEIGLTLQPYQAENRRMIMAGIGIAFLLIALLFGVMRWVLSSLLKKPMDTLIGSITEVVKGKYQQLASPQTYEEFSPIVSSIDTMSAVVANREESLRKKSEELEHYFTSALDLLCIADTDGYFLKLNPEWEETLGYPMTELVGRKFLELVHPDDMEGTLQALSTLSAQNSALNFTNRYRHKDGSYRWIEWRSYPVGTMIYASARDITERKRAEDEISRLNEELHRHAAQLEQQVAARTAQLEAANKELEAFSYSASHDLRAPLQTIDGFSRALLEDYGDKLGAEAKDYLQRLRAAAQHMAGLIDDLLKLSRLTRADMALEPVDLGELACAVADELRAQEPAREVAFEIAADAIVQGDKRLLAILIQNLLGNAWKFTSKHPRARIEFGVAERDGERVYYVRDDGAGFDMTRVDKLFIPFQRLHTTSDFPGQGIGLATVRRIVARHGGRIWAEAMPEQGATFYFTLPAAPARTPGSI